MHNLTVDTAHTFFVGGVEVLVHNCDYDYETLAPEAQIKLDYEPVDPASETVRVGRWMSQREYDDMVSTGMVQPRRYPNNQLVEPQGGGVYVSLAESEGGVGIHGYMQQTAPGSVYAEFDVPRASLSRTGIDWYRIDNYNTPVGRKAERRGERIELPAATNILAVAVKR